MQIKWAEDDQLEELREVIDELEPIYEEWYPVDEEISIIVAVYYDTKEKWLIATQEDVYSPESADRVGIVKFKRGEDREDTAAICELASDFGERERERLLESEGDQIALDE